MDTTTAIADLQRLEEHIRSTEASIRESEDRGIHSRWESGRRILAFFLPPELNRKQLRKGELDMLANELRVDRSEVNFRMKFAKMYPTESELPTLIGSWANEGIWSWSAIKQTKLVDPSRTKPELKTPIQRIADIVGRIKSDSLTADDLPLIADIVGKLNALNANLRELERAA